MSVVKCEPLAENYQIGIVQDSIQECSMRHILFPKGGYSFSFLRNGKESCCVQEVAEMGSDIWRGVK